MEVLEVLDLVNFNKKNSSFKLVGKKNSEIEDCFSLISKINFEIESIIMLERRISTLCDPNVE